MPAQADLGYVSNNTCQNRTREPTVSTGRFQFVALTMTLAILGPGCASMQSCRECCTPSIAKRSKTLLEWSLADEGMEDQSKASGNAKNNDKKSGAKESNGGQEEHETGGETNGKVEPEKSEIKETESKDDEPKEIETDRPDFTEASSTVGRGRIQLETGYTYARDQASGVATHTQSYPEMLLRIGLFADWFELRLGQNFGALRDESPALINTKYGADDFYLGTKLALTEQKKYLPETALIIQTLVPTGSDEFTSNKIMPGVNYLFGWDVIEDCLSCGGSLQVNRAVDDANHFYAEVAQSFTVGYTLTKKLGAYTEWFAFYPAGALSPDMGPEHYFDGGITYKVTSNFQLDIRAGMGLNRHAEDFFAGSGFAVRY